MAYKSARALEMALKEAAKASPLDTGRAVSSFYSHRLLCRVFDGGNTSFVLKGGQSMLARTVDARMTRDIDLLSMSDNLDNAVDELVSLAQADLGDFVSFELEATRPIKVEDKYRDGVSVRFAPYLGSRRMQSVSVDLVVDEVPLAGSTFVTPADRVEVDGVKTCDYLVYPVESALSDKFHAIVERHDGRASSRVKDLVDIAVYATVCDVDGSDLHSRILREARVRGMDVPEELALPAEWEALHARQYSRLAKQTGLPATYAGMDGGLALAKALLDPVLRGGSEAMRWDHERLEWVTSLSTARHEAAWLRVVPYAPAHADELRAVCLSQASERAHTDEAHGRFTLLMYCDAYLECGVAYVLLDDEGVARGYVLAAEDAHVWRCDFGPYRRQIAELGPEYERRVDEELDFYESVADEYPAHLHVDIVEDFTGRGGGRMLMEALLSRLRTDGVRGVVFGVAASNERAVGFYRHMGFELLGEYSDGAGLTFCMKL